MFDVYSSDWPVAVTSTDPRNRFHDLAIREARVATDYHAAGTPSAVRPSLATRLRLALAGAAGMTSSEPCTCPA
jgi:hypothetical protein